MRVIKIIDGTTVDGPGFRTSIYFAGCRHYCPGCHNPSTWNFDAGEEMTLDALVERIKANNMPVTFSGGDPLFQISELIELAKILKQRGINVWCYTGFTYEQVYASSELSKILDFIDVLVDGQFIESQRDTLLLFRGSRNQRLIDVNQSTPECIVEWTSDF